MLHPREDVGGLHGGDFIRLDFREEGRRKFPRSRSRGAARAQLGRQKIERLGPWEVVFQADITLGKRVRSAHEEAPPVGAFGQVSGCGG